MWRAIDGFRFASAHDSESDDDVGDGTAASIVRPAVRLSDVEAVNRVDRWIDVGSAAARVASDQTSRSYGRSDSDSDSYDGDDEDAAAGAAATSTAERLLASSHELDLLRRSGVDMSSAAMRAAADEVDLLTLRAMAHGDKLLLSQQVGDGAGGQSAGDLSSEQMREVHAAGDDLTAAEVAAAVRRMAVSGGWSRGDGGGVPESKDGDGDMPVRMSARWADMETDTLPEDMAGGHHTRGGHRSGGRHASGPRVVELGHSGDSDLPVAAADDDNDGGGGGDGDDAMPAAVDRDRNSGAASTHSSAAHPLAQGGGGDDGSVGSDDGAALVGRDGGAELYDADADDADARWAASVAQRSTGRGGRDGGGYRASAPSYTAPVAAAASVSRSNAAARDESSTLPPASPLEAPAGSMRISCAACFATLSHAAIPLMLSSRSASSRGGGAGVGSNGSDVCAYLATDTSGVSAAVHEHAPLRARGGDGGDAVKSGLELTPLVRKGLAKRYGCPPDAIQCAKVVRCCACGVDVGVLTVVPQRSDTTASPASTAAYVVTDNAVPG